MKRKGTRRRERERGRARVAAAREMREVAAENACDREAATIAADGGPDAAGELMNTRILIDRECDPPAPALAHARRRHPRIELRQALAHALLRIRGAWPERGAVD